MKEKKPQKVKSKECRRSTIGGQAVIEGVMMRGKTASALCVRSEDGEKLLATTRLKKPKTKINRVPVLRGIVRFVSMLVVGMKSLMKSAEVFGTDDEEMPKGFLGFSVFLGIVLAVALFIFVPSLVMNGFIALGCPDMPLTNALIEGALRLLIFIGYLYLTMLLKDIRRTYMYHGAEHKTINCYEHGMPLTVENVRKSSKVHKRCGTTFLFIVLIVTILAFALANWLVVDIFGWGNKWWINLLVRLVLIAPIAGISYEVLKFLAWLPDNRFTAVLRAPGLSLQAITTKEPDDGMIECAIEAFEAVLAMDADPARPETNFDSVSIEAARARMASELAKIDAEACEADWILCDVLKKKRGELSEIERIKRIEYNRCVAYAKKRAEERMPLAYVLGNTEFYGIKIRVTPAVLIPRPETELVAEQAIRLLEGKENASALDLCTGSGCIARALAEKTRARVTAADCSPEALNVAKLNLEGTSAVTILSDLFDGIEDRYDAIVSNPPYIPTGELKSLQEEVKREPVLALNGGADGLDVYRRICAEAEDYLTDDGVLILELGIGQAEAVASMLSGYDIEVKQDYAGIDRILIARRKGAMHV